MEFFFGKEINPDAEQKKIEQVLQKYRLEEPTEILRNKIYAEMVTLKETGEVTIPFQVVLRKEIFEKHRAYIEILLDTKV